ncbi:MAG: HAD-IC family P-type ATPase [Tannerellaceae bacterium]|nr:HAD-IC family P-type ATPase [Tannerellaceae bacterium]
MDDLNIPEKKEWYTLSNTSVVEQLQSNPDTGLTEAEARRRNEQYGKNELPKKKKQSVVIRFLKHFNDILIYILLLAAIITDILGHYGDTIVIIAVAVINAIIGFIQENKAEKALEDIRNMLSLNAQVIRNGERKEIDSTELTPGDIVLLAPGDKVPVDLRLLKTNSLKIEEAILTGESAPSDKEAGPLANDTMLGDQINMAFSSTTITAGTGTGIVVAIGKDTELGKINQLISDTESITTPLIKQTNKLGKTISIAIVAIAVAVYLFGHFFRDYPDGELLMSVIGLAVAAIPEGLPAILSIILAIGVQNMAKRNAIIRNLPSVETLGSVSVICSDKTGTLTKNEMTVKTLITKDYEYQVTGNGYEPTGKVLLEGQPVGCDTQQVLCNLINCFEFCNDSSIGKDAEGQWKVNGDPTEGALLTLYNKVNLHEKAIDRIDTLPFDSSYKYMAVLVKAKKHKLIFIKGAPDRLLQIAYKEKNKEGVQQFDTTYWDAKITELAQRGQRTIGGAYKIVDETKENVTHEDLQQGVVFLGLAGIIDPPREEATEAIAKCKQAGIRVKMITGNHVETAKAIGKEMGIGDGKKALQGKDLERLTDNQLAEVVKDCDIFARTSPEHKIRLVSAIQADGDICAMTGDGVNDAPALKKQM